MFSINWEGLFAFYVVCRTGSLSQAAQKLQISQPTVGRRLDALEESLGPILLERNASSCRPIHRWK